jgi:methanogenic corrinoid protein MtbC1
MDERGTFAADWIDRTRRAIASGAVARQRERQPGLVDSYGRLGFADLVTDTGIRLDYLGQALAAGRPALFVDHLAWLKVSLTARDLPIEFVKVNLDCIRGELTDTLPPDCVAGVESTIEQSLAGLDEAPSGSESLLVDGDPHVDLARRYLLAALEGRRDEALKLVLGAFEGGVSADDLSVHVVQKVQAELGRMWQVGEVHAAEEHFASRIAERLMTLLHDRAPRTNSHGRTVIVASVGGNDHDLGSRMVADRFEIGGWRAVLLGANSPTYDLARSVIDYGADLVALSAALTLHVRSTHEVIRTIRALPERADVPVLVGGRPFQIVEDLWEVVGADGSAASAADAVGLADRLVRA